MMSNLNESFNRPQLVWIIEPENKIRFRYESEGGSHGGLAGKTGKKTFPTLKLVNYHGRKQVFVRVSLYTEDKKEHVLEFKGKKHEESKHHIDEKLEDDKTVMFKNLQIISKKKHEIEQILMERKLKNLKDSMSRSVRAHFEKSYSKDVKERARAIMNSVRLYFEAFETHRPTEPICAFFSDVISNQKAAAKGDLRICRLSQVAGSWKGGEEIILLCEKVQKDNIKVKFYETDEHDSVIWQEYGCFSPVDVHYQVAIPFKTPPYRRNVEKTVFICLERNGEMSEPREFTYKPEETSSKKRKLNTHQTEAAFFLDNIESSESVSSMNISSPESDTNVSVEMKSASNSQSDDSNQLDEIPIDDELSCDIINVLASEDYSLPFDDLIVNDLLDNLDAFDIPEKEEQIYNHSAIGIGMLGVEGQMGDVQFNSGFEMNQSLDLVDIDSGFEMNQSLDLVDIDSGLRNFTLSENDTLSENCSPNKFLQKESKNSQCSETLLQRKKQISCLLLKRNELGNTLLHNAILLNKKIVSILKLCHIAKIDLINTQNSKNETALHLATEKNRFMTVKVLLLCGGDPNMKDANGNNCYHIAAKNNSICVLQEINKFSHFLHEVSDFNDEGLTPIHIAIMQKNSEHFFDILKIHMTKSNILERKGGKSLLHYAVNFQPSLLPKLLQMANIDIDVQDFEGNTPLHLACANENIKAIKQLLQSGADPLIKNFRLNSNLLDLENSEDASDGQLPSDLTTNIEILKLLRAATETKDLLNLQNCGGFQGSDEMENKCQTMEKLVKYLDEDMKWKKIAPFFLDPDVIESLNLSSSPTKTLLDYVKKEDENGYLKGFKTALEFAELGDAVNIMNEYV